MSASAGTPQAKPWLALVRWFDSWAGNDEPAPEGEPRVDWLRCLPFIAVHVACISVFWVGASWTAVLVAIFLYWARMFAITAFYHRYFSHRAFKTSRVAQFLFAVAGNTAVQRGPLWWAAHHREHHQNADTNQDPHSPALRGFWWSHVGWFTAKHNFVTRLKRVPDLARFPELCFLDRFDVLVPVLASGVLYAIGELFAAIAPGLGTNGPQLLVWGVISTVVLFHGTFTINSLSHVFGKRRFETADTSRNNPWLAAITLGEGWHNNHHHYPASARQGFYRGEFDPAYSALVVLRSLGVVWDLKPVPAEVLNRRRLVHPRVNVVARHPAAKL